MSRQSLLAFVEYHRRESLNYFTVRLVRERRTIDKGVRSEMNVAGPICNRLILQAKLSNCVGGGG